jgi:capsular exopolysaccharide synthesis family protein
MQADNNISLKAKIKQEFSLREFIMKYFHVIPWALVTISISLAVVYIKIRYTNPIYQASGKIIVKSENNNASSKGKFSELYMMQSGNTDFEDQIELIRSSSLARLVVETVGLQMQYFYIGSFRTTAIHSPRSPIECTILSHPDSTAAFSLQLRIVDDNTFTLAGNGRLLKFGLAFQQGNGTYRISKRQQNIGSTPNKDIIVSWTPAGDMAKSLAGQMQVGSSTSGSHVLTFSVNHEDVSTAKDIINGYLSVYEQYALSDKKASARNTIDFINGQLALATDELGGIESNLQGFRERNKVLAPEAQATIFLDKMNSGEKIIEEQGIRLKLIDYMSKYLANDKNTYRGIPIVMGLDDENFSNIVSEYNKLQLQREIALNTMPAGNPIIRDFETAMGKQRNEMIAALANAKENLQNGIQTYLGKTKIAGSELSGVPGKQRLMLDIMRKQKIAEELYTFLLEKKLETSIGAASTVSNVEVLESAFSSGIPVSPNTKSMYMIAFVLGLAVPIAFLFVAELLNDKIRNKADLDNLTTAPILGEVGHSDAEKTLIITTKDRKFISEQFRILRTNLQYILPFKNATNTLIVTSSISGEGKSFISTNIAAVMAVSGKKTVILEFDIRKPKVMKGLGLDYKKSKGISNYLVGKATIEDIIQPVPDVENLYVIPCGPIPPNPAELILNDRLAQLFDEVKQEFEVVIIDTAPVGLVSDGFVLAKYADACAYIVRHNYTFKKQIEIIEGIYQENKLKNMSLVINDVQAQAGYGKYYGYVNYGYVNYGYGSDLSNYFDVTGKKGFFRMIRKVFGV